MNAPVKAPAKTGAPLLLILLAASYCLAYFDRLLMAVVAEPVKMEFDLSDKQLSLLTGAAFVLIYGGFGIISGWLIDRFSRKKIVAISLTFWSILTMACGYAGNFVQLAIARAGVGVGESAAVPAAMSIIADTYAPEKRPLAIGIFFAGGMLGILGCFTLGGWVATEYGWRTAFLIAGPPGLILALLIAWLAKEPEREIVVKDTLQTESTESSFREVWNNKALVWLIGAGAVVTFVNVGLVNWLGSFFMRSHGMSLQEVSLIFGPVLAAGMAAGLLGGGWLGNRLAATSINRLISFSTIIVFALIPLYLVIFMAPSVTLALIAMFVGTGVSVLYSPSYQAAWQAICAPNARGTAAGISSFANALIGGALCPYIMASLSDYLEPEYGKEALRYALMAGMLFCLVSGVMFIRAGRLVRAMPG